MNKKNRGEKGFKKFPKQAALIYDKITSVKAQRKLYEDIGIFLSNSIKSGKLLEIGFGAGRVLESVIKNNKNIEIYGIDISNAMVELAKGNIKDTKVNLIEGNIEKTEYKGNFFDIITCTGSFYLWDKPVKSLNEIFRILKKDGNVYLFETYKEYDKKDFKKSLKENLKNENIILKLIGPFFIKKQLSLTYRIKEIEDIIKLSNFKNNFNIEKIKLGNLSIWAKISLKK